MTQSSSEAGAHAPVRKRRLPYALAWKAGSGAAASVLLGFLLLPIVALLATLSWSEFREGLAHPDVWPALRLSLFTTSISLGVIVVFGTPLAWWLSRSRSRFLPAVETFVRLPAVLPPAVAGVALLLAFGRRGLLGSFLIDAGLNIAFSTYAVIVAEVFVASPFYLQAATTAFRQLDESQLTVARSLGAKPSRVFFVIALPLAAPALIAGAAMAWARALGEFGATIMFAGSMTGETETLTLLVYRTNEGSTHTAQAISVLLVAVAFTLLFTLTSRASRQHSSLEV